MQPHAIHFAIDGYAEQNPADLKRITGRLMLYAQPDYVGIQEDTLTFYIGVEEFAKDIGDYTATRMHGELSCNAWLHDKLKLEPFQITIGGHEQSVEITKPNLTMPEAKRALVEIIKILQAALPMPEMLKVVLELGQPE